MENASVAARHRHADFVRLGGRRKRGQDRYMRSQKATIPTFRNSQISLLHSYCTGFFALHKDSVSDFARLFPMRVLWISTVFSLLVSLVTATVIDIWLSERIAIWGSFIGFQYSLNPGIAWGIRLPPVIQEILIICALIAVGYMAYRSIYKATSYRLSAIGFGLILGGGIANIIDRFRDGYVTDFMQIGSFPIFNVADSFVTIGVGLLLLETLLFSRGKKSEVRGQR